MVRFTDSGGGSGDGLAPVIPLFGGSARGVRAPRDSTWGAAPGHDEDDEGEYIDDDIGGSDDCAAIEREIAERNLLKKLRGRSLSVREARAVVADRDLDAETVDAVIAEFLRLGYLDDAALAEQLIHAGSDRKGQGRTAIAQTLAKRGVPRDVADAALDALPDDDAERALEFARSKATSMRSLDREVALRRLAGQLARRGYGGSTAMTAARTALDETGASSFGVRFR